jgi:hypothetical protein
MTDTNPTPAELTELPETPTLDAEAGDDEPAIVLPQCHFTMGWKEYWRALDIDSAMCLALVCKLHGRTPQDLVEDVLRFRSLIVPMSNFEGLELGSGPQS